MIYQSPLQMLYRWEKETPEKVYLSQPINGQAHTWTWKQTADEVRRMAAAIKAMNLPAQSNIAMVSKNCAHWILCDLAIMMSGHVSVPLYPNQSAAGMKQILEHSGSVLLFVGKLDDWNAMKAGVPQGLKCISFPHYPHTQYPNWSELIQQHEPIQEDVLRNASELASIIYTSGTTGMPKGAMHTFNNFSFATENAVAYLKIGQQDRFFSYLPLSHIAERLLVEMGSLYACGHVSFAETLDSFAANLAAAKPTVFLGVPRIWTKFQQGVLAKLPQSKLNVLLKIPFVSGFIKKKIRTGLGFNEVINVFTGAAPTPVSLINWFATIGLHIQEAYAATENCCYSHVTINSNIKIGYVGQALPKCDVKLGSDKEILIKHDGLMTGYYKEPQLTKEAFDENGFLKMGDEGYIDSEGFLKITGRVKDLFKTSKGKYVAPSPIEMLVAGNSDIEQVCVVGTGLPQPIALVVLSENGKKKDAAQLSATFEDFIKTINPQLDHHEQLDKLVVLKGDWTLENNLLTPTLKIKRNELEKKYAANYEIWQGQKGVVVFEQ